MDSITMYGWIMIIKKLQYRSLILGIPPPGSEGSGTHGRCTGGAFEPLLVVVVVLLRLDRHLLVLVLLVQGLPFPLIFLAGRREAAAACVDLHAADNLLQKQGWPQRKVDREPVAVHRAGEGVGRRMRNESAQAARAKRVAFFLVVVVKRKKKRRRKRKKEKKKEKKKKARRRQEEGKKKARRRQEEKEG